MTYLDLEIFITGETAESCSVEVLRSPAGEARGAFRSPFDRATLARLPDEVQKAALLSRNVVLPQSTSLVSIGCRLFDALFAGPVRDVFDASRREAAQRSGGLRIELHLRAPGLAALPWEYLHDPRDGDFLALRRGISIVRHVDVMPGAVQPIRVASPLRVLGVLASPKDLPRLDVESERRRVEEALSHLRRRDPCRRSRRVELTWIEGATWRTLQRALWQDVHVLHFVGHGGVETASGRDYLALCSENGDSERLYAEELGRLLGDHHSLRLVLLNACSGARAGAFRSSIAETLVHRGVPAVLAMQCDVSDRAAIELSRTFYGACANGQSIDTALSEARQAETFARSGSLEWGVPVLHTSSDEIVLFEASQPAPSRSRWWLERSRPAVELIALAVILALVYLSRPSPLPIGPESSASAPEPSPIAPSPPAPPPDPCSNWQTDGHETDVDCGGDECAQRCGALQDCEVDSDCGEQMGVQFHCEQGTCH